MKLQLTGDCASLEEHNNNCRAIMTKQKWIKKKILNAQG